MNECFEHAFNSIYKIFVENGLIVKSDYNEQEKKQMAFEKCLPFFLSIQQLSIENEMYGNVERLVNLLNINIDDKENMKKIFDLIAIEISKLKHSLDLCQSQIQQQQTKLNALESKILMQELKMNAYEIVNLFRSYFVDDTIKNVYPNIKNWEEFTDQWGKREMQIVKSLNMDKKKKFADEVQNDPLIIQWVSPIEKKIKQSIQLQLHLLDMRKIANQRHSIAHQELKSIVEQRDFIEKCQQLQFPEEYEFSILLKQMVDHLAALDIDITNTKLKALH